jgi:hypothetical protein
LTQEGGEKKTSLLNAPKNLNRTKLLLGTQTEPEEKQAD